MILCCSCVKEARILIDCAHAFLCFSSLKVLCESYIGGGRDCTVAPLLCSEFALKFRKKCCVDVSLIVLGKTEIPLRCRNQ